VDKRREKQLKFPANNKHYPITLFLQQPTPLRGSKYQKGEGEDTGVKGLGISEGAGSNGKKKLWLSAELKPAELSGDISSRSKVGSRGKEMLKRKKKEKKGRER